MFARVFMQQQIALVALSLFDDDDAKKGVQLIRERREKKEGLGIIIFRRLFVSTQQKEQICRLCFLTHLGREDEDAR